MTCVAPDSLQARLRRGDIPCRGANLGGWLVAEHWMTWDSCLWHGVPDEIKNQGEFATMKFLGHEEGDRRFDKHRRTWVTESDIAEMKRFGLNTVRVPVGYWIMGFDLTDFPNKQEWAVFAPHALRYLDELVNHWCVKYDIAVIVDIHAAKGSQNGRDHSAAVDCGVKYWGQYPENVDNTVYLANFLASRYRYCPAFLGVGLLNEPEVPTAQHVLRAYYERQNRNQVLQAIRRYGDQISSWSGNWLLIDEWSLGAQECAFPSADRYGLKQFASAQLEAFNKAHSGWIFWSWRHSDDGHNRPTGWSMRQLLRDGIIQLK
ncbi:unnamed protein product [Peronospora belbahrii]|uniref:glucan 1,3-beta-glucosidase n=1 Tax=Peronospora belbahrii TaxID=622444 RepID=A0ABN8D7H2_9STRA|nr:unnamed protein product [Peronospora belbahrii]